MLQRIQLPHEVVEKGVNTSHRCWAIMLLENILEIYHNANIKKYYLKT